MSFYAHPSSINCDRFYRSKLEVRRLAQGHVANGGTSHCQGHLIRALPGAPTTTLLTICGREPESAGTIF